MPPLRHLAAAFPLGVFACGSPPPASTAPKPWAPVPTSNAQAANPSPPTAEAGDAGPSVATAIGDRGSGTPAKPNTEPPSSPEEAFCHGRPHCSLANRVGKPLQRDGFIHSVERIVLVAPEEVRRPPGEDAQGACSVEEYWFLKTNGTGKVLDYQLLTGGCTGEDADEIWCGRAPTVSVTVSGETVSASWYSPFGQCWSAFSSNGRFTASLVDFKTIKTEASTGHAFAGYSNGHEWDWTSMSGSESFLFQAFSPDGSPLPEDRCADVNVKTRVIPSFSTAQHLSDDGWKTADLKGCSTSFHTSVLSSVGNTRGTELHAFVGTGGILYLQLDPVSLPSEAAHFELCFRSEVLNDSNYCEYPASETCSRMSVAGKMLQGDLAIEKASDAYRYAIDASMHAAVRLMYRDPEHGVGIWSSTRGVGKRFSHSPLMSSGTREAECTIQDEKATVLRRRPPQEKALSTWAG